MFGYVEPEKAQLRLWEYEQYRALYCGLCRSMGKHTGGLSRLTLNYDFVFLAMIRTALTGELPEFVKSRCAVHPMKPRAIARDGSALAYCANVGALLAYYKVCDNIADKRGVGRLGALAVKPFAALALHRTRDIGALEVAVRNSLGVLGKLEKAQASPDACAEEFGKLMAELFAFGLEDEKKRRIAHEIGLHTGRFIYIADALDDFEDDIKTGSYNPFFAHYGDDISGRISGIETGALLELESLGRAVELADFSLCPGYGAAVKNIVYLGMPAKLRAIMKMNDKTNKGDARSNGRDNKEKSVHYGEINNGEFDR